jgi:hypothetical protein
VVSAGDERAATVDGMDERPPETAVARPDPAGSRAATLRAFRRCGGAPTLAEWAGLDEATLRDLVEASAFVAEEQVARSARALVAALRAAAALPPEPGALAAPAFDPVDAALVRAARRANLGGGA